MSTIPASLFVQVVPSVLPAGGGAVAANLVVLTESTRVPIDVVYSFASASAVADFFGSSSREAIIAGGGTNLGSGYFGGFSNASAIPAAILFAQYNPDDVSAYLRGGNAGAALTLAQLQAISGTLIIVVDGVTLTVPSLNLSAATSFSSAASIIQAALVAAAPAGASVTGSIGGSITAKAGATFTGTGSGTNLTVASISGVLHVGAQLSGTGVPAGTFVVSQTSGTAGSNGVYVTNHATTSSGDAITATSNVLDVTAVGSGTLQASDVISGTGVTVGTTILAQLTGSPGSTGTYTLSSFQQFASTTVTALSTVLNVTAVGSGTLEVGALLSGTGITSGSIIEAGITGTGGTGTYRVSKASTTISETITTTAVSPTATYDSTSGAFVVTSGIAGDVSTIGYASGTTAASLLLTQATGAVLSQGADGRTPAESMDAVVEQTTDWVTYMNATDPDATGNDLKLAFAAWKNSHPDRYAYVCWDTDVLARSAPPQTTTLGYLLSQNDDSGTFLISELTELNQAAFVAGIAAAIDFEETNGRTSFAFRSQAGLVSDVTTGSAAVNLCGNPQTDDFGNRYNYYGAVGAASSSFNWLQRGIVTGDFAWMDSYVNQVVMNNSFQLALLNMLDNAKSVPYAGSGYNLIEATLADPIQQFLRFGAFAPGDITRAQQNEVNTAAGIDISNALQTQGYYLQILPASGSARSARTTPPIKFWYLDRGSIQSISLDSISVT